MGKKKINLTIWHVKNFDLHPPTEDVDNSTITDYGSCPRKGFYKHGLQRGFEGKSWSIQFGLATHKYCEVVSSGLMAQGEKRELTDEIHSAAVNAAIEGWENPPLEHKDGFLDMGRLYQTCLALKAKFIRELAGGEIEITRAEDAFDLELPFHVCRNCSWAFFEDVEVCPNCGCEHIFQARHGGRIDQFAKDHGRVVHLIRDWKTTKYKPYNYEDKFDPNNQFLGYTWAADELSGQNFDGVLIETIYNTKTQGPIITSHYASYSEGQIEAWQASMMVERQMLHLMWSRVEELGYLAFPMRTQECGSYGGCRYRECCRSGSAFEIEKWLKDYTIESKWDYTDPSGEESKV